MKKSLSGLIWSIASYCTGGTCVAVALTATGDVAVMDTKNRRRKPHVFTGEEWDAFIAGAKSGEFDRATLRGPATAAA